jgi:5-methylcytosine-specific restriction endonuclease McrA
MSNFKRKPNQVLEERYVKQGSCCYYCKKSVPYENITQDHVIPKSKGGKLRNNSVFACSPCNMAKGSMDIVEFKTKVIDKLKSTLRKIVDNNFIATQSHIDKFRHYYVIFKTLDNLEINNFKPIF